MPLVRLNRRPRFVENKSGTQQSTLREIKLFFITVVATQSVPLSWMNACKRKHRAGKRTWESLESKCGPSVSLIRLTLKSWLRMWWRATSKFVTRRGVPIVSGAPILGDVAILVTHSFPLAGGGSSEPEWWTGLCRYVARMSRTLHQDRKRLSSADGISLTLPHGNG